MHRGKPVIQESVDELKALLKQETNRQKRQRLHTLFLFASSQATSRQEAASLLGVNRQTVGRWVEIYEQAGLAGLLDIYVAAGKATSLSEPVLADLGRQLQRPEGFASYRAMQAWLLETHQVVIKYKTLHKLVRRRFGAQPKVVRPSDIKNP